MSQLPRQRGSGALPPHPRHWKATVGEWVADAVAFLAAHGVPEAPANAELIMAAILGTGRNEVKLQSRAPWVRSRGTIFGCTSRSAAVVCLWPMSLAAKISWDSTSP